MVDASGVGYVDNWPKNPWSANADMQEGTGQGNYTYTNLGTTFSLVGHGRNGSNIFTAP